jgi:DNA recombination protein Rad52
MTFSPTQIKYLSADLDRANVKTREQSGRQLSYIEGWHAIAEANRIFGFDGWMRETMTISCVAERERAIGKRQEPGWSVTYIAKVRVTVGSIVREGCGTGHGIDRDLGQAHESALKEAETDAMKRALMTFGNPFGLALYDKGQAHVSENGNGNSRLDCQAIATDLIRELRQRKTAKDLALWRESPAIADELKKLDAANYERVKCDYQRLMKEYQDKERTAA